MPCNNLCCHLISLKQRMREDSAVFAGLCADDEAGAEDDDDAVDEDEADEDDDAVDEDDDDAE